MNGKAAFCGWIVALTVLPLVAAEISVGRGEITIPPGESRSLEFGNVPRRDTTVLLTITSRLHTDKLAGSWYLLKVVLNGHRVEAARSRGAVRLVNKPVISPVTSDARRTWYDGHGGWMLLYAPDFEAGRQVPFYEGDPYTLVLDVTDLIDPLDVNRLTLTNLASRPFLELKPTEGNLVVQRLTICAKSGESPMIHASPSVTPIFNTGQPAAGPAKYGGQLTPGGGFTITVGQRLWKFASAFSYPNAGLNRLRSSAQFDTGGQAGWSAKVQPHDDGGEVFVKGPDYRLHRTVKFTPRKVEIADELTNVHRAAPLGLLVRHEMSLKDVPVPTVRLAGNADPTVTEYYSPPNPSVHVSLPDQSIGLLCEAAGRIREAAPQVKIMVYYDTQWDTSLDPKRYTIQREIGLTTLLGEGHRLSVINRVRNLGGPLLGNGAPCTRALLATKVPRMIETQHNDYWCYEGNLGTPLGYMNFQTDFGSVTRALRMACLPVGTVLTCEHEATRYLFPFTPIELHYGYLLGTERIVAVHDGNYGWVGKRRLVQLRHFNRDGKLVDNDSATLIGAEARTVIKLAKEEAIVLVRLPLRFEPEENMPTGEHSAWNADVRQTRYGPDAVSLNVRAPQGGVLIVETGEFPLQDGAAVNVRLGDKSQSIKVANRALRINVPAGFSGAIAVERK